MVKNWIVPACVFAVMLFASSVAAQQAPATTKSLPYTAVHDPQFISVADATFMSGDDRVIGVMVGKTAKAYAAGILSQHGLVEDQSPKGPIAITW
jgi:hypothetical protein